MSGKAGFGDFVIAGEFHVIPPAPVDGQAVPIQVDSSGNLLTSTTIPGTPNVNVAQVGGAAVSLGAKLSASSIPVVLATDEAALPVTSTGASPAVQTASWTSSTPQFANFTVSTVGMGSLLVTVVTNGGTFSGGFMRVYGQQNGVSFQLNGMRILQGQPQLYDYRNDNVLPFVANQTWALWFDVGAYDSALIELDQAITGTGTVSVAARASAATTTGPTTVGQVDPTKLNATVSINSSLSLVDQTGSAASIFGQNASAAAFGGYLFNGSNWDRQRTPTTFKNAQATANGNTAVWTPANGKKFRLMRAMIIITGNATLSVAGRLDISFQDSATPLGVSWSAFVPSTAFTNTGTLLVTPWIDMGNGFLSLAANNTLNVNLSAALTAGSVAVQVCGTEE